MSIPLIFVRYSGLPSDHVEIGLDAQVFNEEQLLLDTLGLEREFVIGNAGHRLIGYLTQLEFININLER